MKTNQSTKINLIGCDTIVNSPSLNLLFSRVLDLFDIALDAFKFGQQVLVEYRVNKHPAYQHGQ